MEINPSEVTKILKEQIKKLGDRAEGSEGGQGFVCWRWNCKNLWLG